MKCPNCLAENSPIKQSLGGNVLCIETTKSYICSCCGYDYETRIYTGKHAQKGEHIFIPYYDKQAYDKRGVRKAWIEKQKLKLDKSASL